MLGFRSFQSLVVGIRRYKLDAFNDRADHVIYGIAATTPDSDHLDAGEVAVLNFKKIHTILLISVLLTFQHCLYQKK
ncbi:hypothetical protein DSUL_30040 [Desulfovibrionales bacterium]